MAQSYYSPVTVQSGQVPSTQTDFPMLVSYTDARLKTTGNGGHVANANGYDIRPYSSSSLATPLTYELDTYDATNGIVVMWVKIASLADASVVYLGYGDSALNTNGSSTSTWDSNFKMVHHMGDGTTLSLTDSTSVGTNGTNTGSVGPATGKIGGGGAYNGASQYYTFPTTNVDNTLFAVSFWAFYTGATTANSDLGIGFSAVTDSTNRVFVEVESYQLAGGTGPAWFAAANAGPSGEYTSISTNTWYYVVAQWNSAANVTFLYVNGVQGTNYAFTGYTAITLPATGIVGAYAGPVLFMQGIIDEFRLANTARTQNWITTEFNNQNAPSTFAVLGSEVPLTVSGFVIALV